MSPSSEDASPPAPRLDSEANATARVEVDLSPAGESSEIAAGPEILQRILQASADFIGLATLQGEVTFINLSGRKMLGFQPDDPLRIAVESLHPDWANEIVLKEAIPSALRDGEWRGETAVRHRAGHEIPVSHHVVFHPQFEGSPGVLSMIIRDLSHRKSEEVERIEWANRYDAAIRASGQVLYDWNSFTHEITYAGDLERLFGYTLGEMSGGLDRLRQIIHPDDLRRFDERVQQVIVTRDPFHLEFRVRHKMAGFVFIEGKGYFFLDRRGQIGRMVGFFADITAQREAQDEVARAHENLEQRVLERTAELARAAAVIEDRARQQEAVAQLGQRALSGGSLTALLDAAMKLVQSILRVDCCSLLALTVDKSEFIARAQIGWPPAAAGNRIGIGRNSQSGYTLLIGEPVIVDDFMTETRFARAEGVIAAGLTSSVSVLIEGDAEPLGVVAAFTHRPRRFTQDDVHFLQAVANVLTAAIQRERAEESVRQAREQAEMASRAKSDFLSRMSHELRTPLNAILGFTQLLELDAPSPTQAESVQHISRAGRHLLALINEVLDISRIEAGQLTLTLEPIDVREILTSALESIRPLAAHHQIALFLGESTTAGPQLVLADRARLQQVLLNLLSNAVKYNRPGGRVTISAQDEGARLRISIADTGLGIAPDKLARLFLPFERLGAETSEIGGTGIGLALSRGIVTALHGELNAESRVGEGSTFWLSLPRAESAPPTKTVAVEASTQRAASAAAVEARLLYIEDEELNLRLVERVLRSHPQYQLLTAIQGHLGFEIACAEQPDVILLDLNLPDMSGEEVLRRLKAEPATKDVPVIMVSADAMGERVEQLLRAGASGYLTKPYKLEELLRVIRETLDGRERKIPLQ